MPEKKLTLAWMTYYPVAWMPNLPPELEGSPRGHPAPWERILLNEFASVPNLDLHVFSVDRFFPVSTSFRSGGVNFHCVKVPGRLRLASNYWLETLLIRRKLAPIKPDMVHAWGMERGGALVASRMGRPHLVTVQGLLSWAAKLTEPTFYQKLEVRLEKPSMGRARMVTAESGFAVSWLKDLYPHLDVLQVEHAPDPVFFQVDRSPVTAPIRFLHVGHVTQLKGTDLLLRALDQLRKQLDFQLVLVTTPNPSYMAVLRGMVSPDLWDRVVIKENLTQQQIAAGLAQATMVLFPTRADNSPNSVKEAVVAGVPVVASRVGGLVDYVIPGENGVLFESGNLGAFKTGILEAVSHPAFGRGRVNPGTHDRMRAYLSPSTMKKKFLEAYDAVLGRRAVNES